MSVIAVSTHEVLGMAPLPETRSPRTACRLKRLQRMNELPPADQRAVLKMLDALAENREIKEASWDKEVPGTSERAGLLRNH